ncbi:unnamed protein product [Rotaria sp. Silwood2]|nr:unnamed protein product [Rotaria sp. Silwood2]CAF4199765.1 unnamed protein product [Rotaria sp. Silwood2]
MTDRPLNRHHWLYRGLTLKDILTFVLSLLLPLMLGIFTIVISFHEQNVVNQQRIEDRQLAREQHKQDLNISRQHCGQDLNTSFDQHAQYKEIARLQRLQDELKHELDLNISRVQRELDKEIAALKRAQDNDFAEKRQNLSFSQSQHELDVALNRYRDILLVSYVKMIGKFLQDSKGNLSVDSLIHNLIRAKTLIVIRQLDPVRKRHLNLFLYEVGILTYGQSPIVLSSADLNDIDWMGSNLSYISLVDVTMRNNSFFYCFLIGVDFHGQQTDLSDSNFYKGNLQHALFHHTRLHRTNFTSANLTTADLTRSILEAKAIIECSYFNNASISKEMFDHSRISHVSFYRTAAIYSTFRKC